MTKQDNQFKFLLAATAFLIAAVAAFFSIFGISKLFAGFAVLIIIMASGLEVGKVVAVSYLQRYWRQINKWLRAYLFACVLVLMTITSAGIYGFLSNAYQVTATELNVSDSKIKLIDTKQATFEAQINQLNSKIENKNVRNATLMDLRESQERRLDSLYLRGTWNGQNGAKSVETNIAQANAEISKNDEEINSMTDKVNSLQDSILQYDIKKIEANNTTTSADLGPLKYLARLTGKSMDVVINWFILMIIFVFDPFAICLLIAYNHMASKDDKSKSIEDIIPSIKVDPIIVENTNDEVIQENSTIIEETVPEETLHTKQIADETNENPIIPEESISIDTSNETEESENKNNISVANQIKMWSDGVDLNAISKSSSKGMQPDGGISS